MKKSYFLFLLPALVLMSCTSQVQGSSEVTKPDSSTSNPSSEMPTSSELTMHKIDDTEAKQIVTKYKDYANSVGYKEPQSYKSMINNHIQTGEDSQRTTSICYVDHEQEKIYSEEFLGLNPNLKDPVMKNWLFKNGESYVIANDNFDEKKYVEFPTSYTYNDVCKFTIPFIFVSPGSVKTNINNFMDIILNTKLDATSVVEKNFRAKGEKTFTFNLVIKNEGEAALSYAYSQYVFQVEDYQLLKMRSCSFNKNDKNEKTDVMDVTQTNTYQKVNVDIPSIDNSWIKENIPE